MPRRFLSDQEAIQESSTIQYLEFYDIELSSPARAYHFVNVESEIRFPNNETLYTPFFVSRDSVSQNITSVNERLTVRLDNVSREFAELIEVGEEIIGGEVTITKASRTDLVWINSVQLFHGYIDNYTITVDTATFELTSFLDVFRKQFPRRIFTPFCQWTLYSTECAVNRSDFSVTAYAENDGDIGIDESILKSSSLTTFIDGAGNPSSLSSWFKGRCKIVEGTNAGYIRKITGDDGNGITFDIPFPRPIDTTTKFQLSRYCEKTYTDCRVKFNNGENFGGFPYVPLRSDR